MGPTTALIVPVELPPGPEAVRQARDPSAAAGICAHLTVLYPFVAPDAWNDDLRAEVAAIVERHEPFDYRLVEVSTWPDTIYLRPEPAEPFKRLQSDLGAAYPEYPIYGGGLDFEPHVTLANVDPETDERRAALAGEAKRASDDVLPLARRAERVDVIAEGADGRWTTIDRIELGGGWRDPGGSRG